MTCGSTIPSTDGHNGANITISKCCFLPFIDLKQKVLIEEKVNKCGQRMFQGPRMIATSTVCGIQVEKLFQSGVKVSIGTLMLLKPFSLIMPQRERCSFAYVSDVLTPDLYLMQWWQKKRDQVGQSLFPSHNFSLMIVNAQFHQMVFWAGVVLMENVKNVNPILCTQFYHCGFKFVHYSQFEQTETPYYIIKKMAPKLLRKHQKRHRESTSYNNI